MNEFVHIHLHTYFSCLDGYSDIKQYIQKAKKNNIKYFSVTDHGNCACIPKLIQECRENEIKPIFGCEFYVNNFHHLVPNFKNLSDEEKYLVKKNNHLILIAKNDIGYENLIKLSSESWINGFYYKPRISLDLIKKYSEGLICTTACLGSELSQYIIKEKYKEAIDLVKEYKDIFGKDYYLEIQMINMKEQDHVNSYLISLSNKLDIPLVLTNDVHYCEKSEFINQQILLLLNSKGTISKPEGLEFHTNQLWYKTIDELDELWENNYKSTIPLEEYKESKINTVKICEKCNVVIDTNPKFPKIENAENEISERCITAMKKKGLYKNKIYRDRFLKEYEVIFSKNYCSYFMVVTKIIEYVKNELKEQVGPGRGSCGGSLICYLLGITQVDPIKHELFFERFLSKSRGGKFAKLQFEEKDEII